MLFPGNGCQLITAERRARKGQLSAGIDDFAGEARILPSRSNNNEAMDGVALFCAGLTLETYVTGALNPVKRARLRAEEGNDGKRNPP